MFIIIYDLSSRVQLDHFISCKFLRNINSRFDRRGSGAHRAPHIKLMRECQQWVISARVDPSTGSGHVRFSNRPFGVKRFQTIHNCGVDVAHGLVLLFGIGTKALP